jgi:uridine kinase
MPSITIGIAGGSASGKSTFSQELVRILSSAPPLSSATISTDDYFLPHELMPRFFSPSRQIHMPDYNQPDSIDLPLLITDINKVLSGGTPPDVFIIEGLMVLYIPQIRELLDLRLYIELDADQRALRRLVRNLGMDNDSLDGINTPQTIANYFLESAKVGHERFVDPSRIYADLILRGDGDHVRTAAMIAAIVREKSGKLSI